MGIFEINLSVYLYIWYIRYIFTEQLNETFMKNSIAKIKINSDLSWIKLECDQKNNGHWGTICQWNITGLNLDQKEVLYQIAKATLFDETWKLTEMGYKVEVIPYLN